MKKSKLNSNTNFKSVAFFSCLLMFLFSQNLNAQGGTEIFEGPGTDFYNNANWFDGSAPSNCGAFNASIIIDSDAIMNCNEAGGGPNSVFHLEGNNFTVNSGKKLTYQATSHQARFKNFQPMDQQRNN